MKSSRKRDAFAGGRDAHPTRICACLIDIFGRDNVVVEIQRHFLRGEDRTNQRLCDLAEHYRLPVVATNGVQYARPNGRQALDVFTCIREHTHLDAAGKLLTRNAERHLKSDAEMRALFPDRLDAIENTARVAERLEFSLENIGYEFPAFPVPDGHDMNSFLRTITLFGAQQRYSSISTAVKAENRRGTEPDPTARVLRLFFDRLGHH